MRNGVSRSEGHLLYVRRDPLEQHDVDAADVGGGAGLGHLLMQDI